MWRSKSARSATLTAMLLLGASSRAEPGAANAERVVARASDAVLTVETLERRLNELSPAERAALGGAPAEAPRRFVEEVLAKELQAELAARARGLERSPTARDRSQEILRDALDRALRTEILAAKPVTDEEIAAYYQENKARFEQPAKILIWRILVPDAKLAEKVLSEARSAGTPAKWRELARAHSIDTATHLRRGELGFVRADGSTDVPRVRVDPALYSAALAVKDGEFVAEPVPELGKFAVVWRRGSLPARSQSLADEAGAIRVVLERQRVDEARRALIAKLRKEWLKEEHPELLEKLPEGSLDDARPSRPRPPATQRRADVPDKPAPSERGLR